MAKDRENADDITDSSSQIDSGYHSKSSTPTSTGQDTPANSPLSQDETEEEEYVDLFVRSFHCFISIKVFSYNL